MRKIMMFVILLSTVIVLGACGDKNNNTENKEPDSNVNNVEPDTNLDEGQNNDTENQTNNENENNGDEDNATGNPKGDTEDQLDLSIGDTGTFDTTLGQYEMTLNKAELIDGELEGEKSTRDGYILLDITIKNVSDETLDLEDLIYSMEVTDNLDYTGSQDHADVYDTVDAFEGDIEPGEEKSAQFLTIVDDSEEYFFRKAVGNVAGGSSNQVIWSFSAEEAK